MKPARLNMGKENHTAAILAGGRSRRMNGYNKALLSWRGTRLLDKLIERLESEVGEVIVVTSRRQGYNNIPVRIVEDIYPDCGSLGGLYSALYSARTQYCFVFACDMPFISTQLIRHIKLKLTDPLPVDAIVPRRAGKYEPLHALYSKDCIETISTRLESNNLRITDIFKKLRVRSVGSDELENLDFTANPFFNINTVEDYQRAKKIISPGVLNV